MTSAPFIQCDHEQDGEQCNRYDHPPGARTFGESRRRLAREGWRRRDGRDYCPDHAAAPTT